MERDDVRTRGARVAAALEPWLAFTGWLVVLVVLVVLGVVLEDCAFVWRHERLIEVPGGA